MVLFPHAEPRRSRAAMARATFFGMLLAILSGGWSAASAADVQGTIDFDVQGLPAGTILESVELDLGGGATAGPVEVRGTYPGAPQNRAVIFDSTMRSGGDDDLGTPNVDFGGPGIGSGGGAGSAFPNDQEQFNILVVAENLNDANGDGLVDGPDDGTLFGMLLEFDFRSIQAPFRPAAVTVYSITTIDLAGANPGEVRFFDDNDVLITTIPLVSTGNNALNTVSFGAGVFGAARMVVQLNESSAIDDIVMELHSDPDPTCEISPSGPLSVTVGEEVCFDVTGAVGTPMSTVCNGSGSCAPHLTAGCAESANVHWDFTGCVAFSGNQDFSEFVPSLSNTCPGVSLAATVVSQSQHSCNSDVLTGAGGGAMCVPVSTNPSYDPTDTALTTTFDVTVTESDGNIATVEEFSFYHSAGTWVTQHQTGGSPIGFSNDPPEFYSLRVLRDGVQILLLQDLTVSDAWVQTEYAFSDPQFEVTNSTAVFTFELYAYGASGNSAQLRIWDLDEFDVSICCSEENAACPETVTIAQIQGAAGAVATPALPLDSSPNSSATTTVCWTPTGSDIGVQTFEYSVTDCKGDVSTCMIEIEVVCDLEFNAGGQPDDLEVCEGDSATFMVNALQNPGATTQWFRDGVAIPGATSDTLMLTNVQVSDAGSYTAVLTSVCGTITSDPATLTVDTPPSVTLDSTPIEECEGESVTLMGSASGTSPITYSWTKDGVVLPGENNATLTLNPLSPSDAGSYVLTASNLCGDDSSAAVVVTVLEGPTITASPMGQTVCEGDPVTFGVMASGSNPLSYQWFLDGVAIPGATGAMFTIPAASTSDAGNYTVSVANACETETAGPASLTVRTAPMVTSQPSDVTDCAGSMAALTFMADGSSPLTIAWFQDGMLIPGETGTTLTIAALTPADAGSYTATVTNDCGTATTDAAVVSVLEAPTMTAQPMDQTLCEGEDLTLTVAADGSAPISYQWFFDGAAIPGATSATLMIPGVTTANAGSYTVNVSNTCDTITSDAAVLTVRTAPTITAQPQGVTDCEGATIVLSLTATGSEPLTYAWAKDGVPIPGETMATLTIANAMASDSGSYTATVTNDCGMAMTDAAVVVVLEAPEITAQPSPATLCEGETLNLSVMAAGSAPLAYQWFVDGVPIPGATMATFSIPGVTTADAGSYTVEISNTCGMVTSTPAAVEVREAPTVTSQPQGGNACLGTMFSLMVTATGSSPLSYQWFLDGVAIPGETGETLSIGAVALSDGGTYTVQVTNDCGMATSDGAVLIIDEPRTITVPPQSQTVCEGDMVTFTVTATGTAPLSTQWRLDGVDIPGATMMTYTIPVASLADAGSYDVVITNDCGMDTSAPATLTVQEAPVITAAPMGATACLGDSVVLSVLATGSLPLTYQWTLNGVDISGATMATLDLGMVDLADAGMYAVVISNACGTVTSESVVVDVLEPPTIDVNPMSQDLCEGDTLNLMVSVSGSPPLSVQWRLNGVAIPGETGMTLSISNLTAADAGSYSAFVSNECGDATSADAVVTVGMAPTITIDSPTAVEECEGTSITLMATVDGAAPLGLQWKLDGVDIPGAHDASFTIPAVMVGDAGVYTLMAMNDCGMATSGGITLTVREAPTITVPPTGGMVCPDEMNSFTFTATATGSEPLTYTWFLDGAMVGSGASLTVTDITAADFGGYTVVVSNDCGSDTSAPALLEEPPVGACDVEFQRGDCNADGTLNIADPIFIMRFTFQGFAGPVCFDPCDFNDDGTVDISDTIYAIAFIFTNGPEPLAPFDQCGPDPSMDNLDCPSFSECVDP